MFASSAAARYSLSALVGIGMTAAIFFLMYRLVGSGPLRITSDDLFAQVTIYQPPPETPPPPTPQKQPEAESKVTLEPELAPLSVSAPAANQNLALPGPSIATDAPAMGDIAVLSGSGAVLGIGAGGSSDAPKTWTAPGDDKLAKKIAAADAKGANGYREITPISTRQPNVPEIAWKNKINGWVLVAFTVNARGFVENVRVLDAQPRGVFEDNVVASVKNWVYSPADFGGRKVKAQLTQKIELFYKDYPNNNKQLQ